MKTEEFDDAIRRKAESAYYPPKEADIDRIHKHIGNNLAGPSFLQRYGLVSALSVCGLVVIGLLTWNIARERENSELKSAISTLKNDLAQAKQTAPAASNNTNTASSINTATTSSNTNGFTAENSTNNSSPANQNNNSSNNINGNTYTSQNSTSSSYSSSTNSINSSSKHSVNNPGTYTQENSSSNQNNSVNTFNKNSSANSTSTATANNNSAQKKNNNIPTQNGNGTDVNSSGNSQNTSTADARKPNNNLQKQNTENSTEKNSAIANNTAASSTEKNSAEKAKETDTASKEAATIASETDANKFDIKFPSEKAKQHTKSNFSLKNIHLMAGLGVEVANKQAGISVLGQASITDRWSFGFGVKTLIVNNEMYNDEDDFHHRKGKDFRQVYGQGNGDTSSIQDIHTHNTLVQIPLAVSYTLPIKNNFGFVFSAGTDLDIYARQVIEYGHFNPGLPEPPKREWSEVRVPALAFNNAVISAGVQKRWGHFVAQLSPYVCPQLTQVVYKKEDFYAGLRFRLFYSFGG